jgi:hypothetical protein
MGAESDETGGGGGYFEYSNTPRPWREGEVKLVPIDHGYSMPDNLEIAWCDWCWFEWPQIHEQIGPEARAYIAALDPEKEAELLRSHLQIREPCVFAPCSRALSLSRPIVDARFTPPFFISRPPSLPRGSAPHTHACARNRPRCRCLLTLNIGTSLLKKGTASGLSLFEIASIIGPLFILLFPTLVLLFAHLFFGCSSPTSQLYS